jgi:hypothetical protein
VHEGQLGKRCTDCHTTGGWHRIARIVTERRRHRANGY